MPTLTTNYEQRLMSLPGVGSTLSGRIVRHLQAKDAKQAWAMIQANPYCLLDVTGIGFKKADAIAQGEFGVSANSEKRHVAGNKYVLSQVGSMAMWEYRKGRKTHNLWENTREFAGVVVDSGRVWLERELKAEQALATYLDGALVNVPRVDVTTLDGLNGEQSHAVALIRHKDVRCVALTGAAGTGKTWTLATLAKLEPETAMMAFSGKAAHRLAQALEQNDAFADTGTIHRMCGIYNGNFVKDPDKLPHDYVVIDEASMIPNWLLYEVMRRLKPSATLVLVGDPAQLPPIGHGQSFQDFLAAGIPHVELTQNYRQANQQAIYELCTAVRERTSKPMSTSAATITSIDDDDASTVAVRRCLDTLHVLDWQVLSWKNVEVAYLNDDMQQMANPHNEPVFYYPEWNFPRVSGRPVEVAVRVGDKVLVTKNEYTFNVFNGETYVVTGTALRAYGEDEVLCAVLENGEQTRYIPVDESKDFLRLGYAVTTHKAQGSGWHTVIVFQGEDVKFNAHSWWYTSISRAAEQLYVFAGASWWRNATRRDKPVVSTLLERL